MKKSKQQKPLIFASILFVLFALTAVVNLDAFTGNNTIAYDAVESVITTPDENSAHDSVIYLDSQPKAAAFLGARGANRQTNFHPLRGQNTQGFLGRTAPILDKLNNKIVERLFAFSEKISGYPSPAFFCVAKDYYVYTLKRILC